MLFVLNVTNCFNTFTGFSQTQITPPKEECQAVVWSHDVILQTNRGHWTDHFKGHVRCMYCFICSAPVFCCSTVKCNVNQIQIIQSASRFGSSATVMNDTFSEVLMNFLKCVHYNLTGFWCFQFPIVITSPGKEPSTRKGKKLDKLAV